MYMTTRVSASALTQPVRASLLLPEMYFDAALQPRFRPFLRLLSRSAPGRFVIEGGYHTVEIILFSNDTFFRLLL
jgi:hypothetical protein